MTKLASRRWPTQRLKFVASVMPSNVDKLTDPDHLPVRLCNYVDVYKNDRISGDMEFMSASATPAQIARFALRGGDVLITKDSETPDDIAVPAYVDSSATGVVCGYHLALLRPITNRMLGRYLFWAICSRPVSSAFSARAQGITRFGLTVGAMGDVPIPLPPPAEQRAIADFLDRETAKIDALIAAQERLIALLDEKRQATITHAVTKGLDPNAPMKESGVEWMGTIPAQWPAVMLRFLLNYIEQGWSPEAEDRRAEPGEWAVLKSGCVNGGIFRQDEHKALPSDLLPIEELEVRPGDVIMSRASGSRALIGSVSYVEKCSAKLMLSDKLFRLRPRLNMISPRYLAIVLGAQPCRAQIEQSISGAEGLANNLTQATIKRLLICLPSLVEQEIIMHHLDRVTAELDQLQFHGMKIIERLRERRTALITAAVTGQIDVTRQAITETAK